jgi:hypothetical protein
MTSRTGLVLSVAYVIFAAYLLLTQGLFGESFIAIILGLPWSLLPAYFEYGGGLGTLTLVLLFVPMIINAVLLYWIGKGIGYYASRV